MPPFDAGAHINLRLGENLTRSYSLANSPVERHRYVIAVKREQEGRGGSCHVHDELRVGGEIPVEYPRHHFPLNESATHTILIAGGIGITPIISMAARLEQLGRSWELHYTARSPAHAAFLQELKKYGDRVSLYFFDGSPEPDESQSKLDIASLVTGARPGTHLYCCGPGGMISEFESLTCDRPPDTIHVERFAADGEVDMSGTFEVVLARSGERLRISENETILDVVLAHGVAVDHSCQEGVCGSCLVRVKEGVPDHHDYVLTSAERASNDRMLICCSRAKTPVLVLDI
ncbi:vanillate O-demethylase ferredoxin subunit [Paraburkholderia tropica]|uniref:Vanillate O-demethylase ferredoxin subunit n=1 Tax=Paraburkholderia tropica TaxID=92647 RepID=A0ABX5MJ13_9BURK|nr:vanillate O-demethylase ferredoxin subunit [Paraburkholderia tropica]PZW76540.1 vanillate O-demethylase ferredoxin subunit [Paraburkholderia tropica]